VTAHDPGRAYVPAAGHDWLLPLYDPLQRWLGGEAAHRQLIEQADLGPTDRVLEIGCGTGNLSLLVKRLHPTVDLVALDPDPKALARARRKADREGVSLQLERGFADQLPYPDGSFARVLSAFMLHHLQPEERARTLRETRRVLAPGGSVHVVDFADADPWLHRLATRLFHRGGHAPAAFDRSIPDSLSDAGLTGAATVAHRGTIFGRVEYYAARSPTFH
jgi:ubiquinone/menaquinone biosynthesis C-methylase UbiE